MTTRREQSYEDAPQAVLYAKRDTDASVAYPLLANDNGVLLAGSGLVPENYDEITLSYTSGNLTGVVYKLSSATIATLTLTYTSGNLTGVVRT